MPDALELVGGPAGRRVVLRRGCGANESEQRQGPAWRPFELRLKLLLRLGWASRLQQQFARELVGRLDGHRRTEVKAQRVLERRGLLREPNGLVLPPFGRRNH